MRTLTAEQFLKDVANHTMTIRLNHGLYRHLRFQHPPPNAWNLWFDIVTWPGSLAIHGDMGSWCFSRVEDMFTFFRSETLRINASYWSEKITSESRFGGPSKTFQADYFKENVVSSLAAYEFSDERKNDILTALQEVVFCYETEGEMRGALHDFLHDGFEFADPWEICGDDYTYHFKWCLHAIVWAIQQYDSAKAQLNEESGPAGGKDA